MKYLQLLFLFLLSTPLLLNAQQQPVNCDLAIPGCTTPSFAINGVQPPYNILDFTGASNPSTNPNPAPGNSGCLLSGETVSTFITISVVSSGTLEWSIQGTQSGCFDWIMWPYTPAGMGGGTSPTCGQLQAGTLPPVACNWNGACGGFTGMAAPGNLPTGASQLDFEYPLNVTAGQTFLLCLSNYSFTNQNVNLNFFGTADVSCTPSVTDQTICKGDSAQVSLNTAGIVSPIFAWTPSTGIDDPNNGPDFMIFTDTTQTYQVHITDGASTFDTTLTFTITVVSPPTPNAGVDQLVCQGSPAQFNSTPSDPADSLTWSFTGPSGTPAPPNAVFTPNKHAEDPTVQVNYSGTYTFILAEDNGVCPAVKDTVIITFSNPQQTYTKTNPLCANSCDGSITINCPGAVSYSINGGAWVASNVFTNLCAGNYAISSKTAGGCTVTTNNVTLTAPPAVTVDAGINQTICVNGTTTIQANATGGTAYAFHWSHTSDTNALQSVTPTASPTYYYVIAENQAGCFSTKDSVQIDWSPLLTASISPNDTICPSDTSQLAVWNIAGGQGAYSFAWYDAFGNLLSNNDTVKVTPSVNSTYFVHITDTCTTPELVMQVQVIMAPVPSVSFFVDTAEQCPPATFTFVNTSTYSSQTYWMFNNGLSFSNLDTVTFTETEPFSYNARLVVVSNQGCKDTLSKNQYFTVFPAPDANFYFTPQQPTMFDAEVTFTDHSSNANHYQWTFTDGTPASSSKEEEIVNFPDGEVGDYPVYLTVWSDFGCYDSTKQVIHVISDIIFYAPNTFTPDGDEFNALWRVYVQGIDIYNFELIVYNRWGEIMWESHNPEASWNGTYGGKIAPDGTYIWVMKAKDITSDKKVEYKGHLNILR